MDKALEFLSNYATSLSYEKLPASTIRAAKMLLIDIIGCALNAYLLEPSRAARRLCVPIDSPFSARVIGSLMRTTPELAAFANGTMIRDLDFNDIYRFKVPTHPSDSIPAMLAIGEALHSDGKSLITSIVLSYEMHPPFAERTPIRNGWDDCALTATLGSALGVGKLLGLTKDQMANAAALAIVPCIPLKARVYGELSNYKELYAGMACRHGIFAALLAREGLTGPMEVIEGQAGLKQMVMDGDIQWEPLGGNGTQFAVERTTIKKYPVRGQIQIFIETALELRKKVKASDIEKITIKTQKTGLTSANTPELKAPKTRETADHSSFTGAAVALIDGHVIPASWIQQRFLDPDVVALMKKMTIVEEPEFTKDFPAKNHCLIEAKTYGGKTEIAHTIVTGATAEFKWTDEALEAKYMKMTKDILTPAQARSSLDIMWHLEDVKDVGRILDHLQV